ncbi:hypothetical protein Trydic_g14181 [Trypoxylus dichotomus]
MSHIFALKGASHQLCANYYPPIELDPRYDYALGLISLHTYNTIPNVTEENNKFCYDNKVMKVPVGSYEISDIEEYLKSIMPKDSISLRPNNNTLKVEIESKYAVNFKRENTLGRLLGFSKRILEPNRKHESDLPVQILKVVTIRIECNIITSSYHDARPSHTLYEVSPQVEPGYSIYIEPQHVIYLPISKSNIENITLTLLDQDGAPVDFRGEQIIIRLELKKL